MKGLIFAGCSFTWGQGLHYYSELDTVVENEKDTFNIDLLTSAQIKYIEANRFPRLVANNFNSFEFVKKTNGGSDEQSLFFLEQLFGIIDNYDFLTTDKLSYSEVDYIVFQLTEPIRSEFQFFHNNEEKRFSIYDNDTKADFYEWLIEVRKCFSLEEWEEEHTAIMIKKIKEKLLFYEEKGIKVLLLCWLDNYLEYIKNDIWLYNRLIPLKHEGRKFDSIRQLMNEYPNMEIINDHERFDTPPQDSHPSIECHKVITGSITEILNKNELNTEDYDLYFDNESEILDNINNEDEILDNNEKEKNEENGNNNKNII